MQLYNTETGRLERFTARDGKVGMYVCGITPYDTTHVGHAFTFLTFDILARLLRQKGLDVTYVQNVTDVDEPLFVKASELGISWEELGGRETQKFLEDMRALNWVEPDHYVKATESIPAMLPIIQALLDKGYAYAAGGNVYFAVDADPEFGKLSHIPRDRMLPIANERGNTPDDPNKRNPLDFVLWQISQPGEPVWESPFGPGRPGWHIECSAMSSEFLGPMIDIHGGGSDLIFPHHEAEVAQSENAFDIEPFARYWVHVGTVDYQGEKMSKSLGNLVFVRDVLADYHPDALRLYLFSHHYREPWEYIDDELDEWASLAEDLREAVDFPAYGVEEVLDVSLFRDRFYNALDDDLNTPIAIEALREIGAAILEAPEDDDVSEAQATLRELSGILGLTLAE
jgi:L-cysteine:1D-myo-inositol 2-amino-2-deoxy-alpha-D-glucopyranoside ligase